MSLLKSDYGGVGKLNDRSEEIVQVATVLFSENGYDNTSTRELAKAVDLSIAGLYYFFQNKEEILFTILGSALSRFIEAVRSAINEDEKPEQNIKRIIDSLVKHVVENKKEMGLISKESSRLKPEQLAIINDKKREAYILIRDEILRLKNNGSLKDFNVTFLTFGLLGIINYAKYWFDPGNELSIEDLAAQTTDLIFNGALK